MLPELFEDIFGCPRIKKKSDRKFEVHIYNITVVVNFPGPPLSLLRKKVGPLPFRNPFAREKK